MSAGVPTTPTSAGAIQGEYVLCVTPNLSLDITVQVVNDSQLEQDATLLAETPGGKGANVARLMSQLGRQAVSVGFIGGWTGRRIEELLASEGVTSDSATIGDQSRYFVTTVDERGLRTRSLHFSGPQVTPAESETMLRTVRARATGQCRWVIIAGSLPRLLGDNFALSLAEAAGDVPVVLDVAGAPLLMALRASPAILKINRSELASIGYPEAVRSLDGVRRAIEEVRQVYSIPEIWVTLGAGGCLAATESGTAHVTLPDTVARNTSGAGDCFLAGLLHAKLSGSDLREQAGYASALAAGSCELSVPCLPPRRRLEALRRTVRVHIE